MSSSFNDVVERVVEFTARVLVFVFLRRSVGLFVCRWPSFIVRRSVGFVVILIAKRNATHGRYK